MSFLQNFITEFKALENEMPKVDTFLENLKQIRAKLMMPEMLASNELKLALGKLQRRAEEPMKVAICGQFSSGKSTFLNALLAKNVLPTGITPVTSKVNYIRYARDLKIKVRYQDGREAYYGIAGLKRFTDQRENVEDIAYLTLYAPVPLLKEVVFVDTPGLNSQSNEDTSTTEEVLSEVDGIIWLTLIDNAGRNSELEVLERYMDSYQNKAICVLNQKDKLSEADVEKTINHVQKFMGNFFDQVVAISAIEALKARSDDKLEKSKSKLELMQSQIQENFNQNESFKNLPSDESLFKIVKKYKDEIQSIQNSDISANLALLNSSNIQKVLDYIYQNIRPKANEAKEFALKKELKNICHSLIAQHKYFIRIYDEIELELNEFETYSQQNFNKLKNEFSKEIKEAYTKIEEMIQSVANEIFASIKTTQKTRYEPQKSFLSKENSYKAYEYKVAKIDSDNILKKLFYDDDLIGKMFKNYVRNLDEIKQNLNQKNYQIYQNLEKSLQIWQKKYEIKRKDISIHSDIEFGNLRRFASKAYESFLKSFNDALNQNLAKISEEFNHLSSAVSFNYQNATEVCIAFLERKITSSIMLYEENPTLFPLYQPKLNDIKERLTRSFHLYELQNKMSQNETFVDKNYEWLKNEFLSIKQEKQSLLNSQKQYHKEKIQQLKEILKNI